MSILKGELLYDKELENYYCSIEEAENNGDTNRRDVGVKSDQTFSK